MKISVDNTYRLSHDVNVLYETYIGFRVRQKDLMDTSTPIVFDKIVKKANCFRYFQDYLCIKKALQWRKCRYEHTLRWND